MDPPIINETSFSAASPSSYTLTGIWPFSSINGGKNETLINPIEKSTVTKHDACGGRNRRVPNDLDKLNGKRIKISGSNDEPEGSKVDPGSASKPGEPPKDYIHVRARRGQATDSHSLAERARREKISERMKILQDLVPGCNKVIGKAPVLDEIINYIQSLQHQVEFLSMKIEAVNTRMNSQVEEVPVKDLGPPSLDVAGLSSQTTTQFGHGSQPEWLHLQLGNSFGRTT